MEAVNSLRELSSKQKYHHRIHLFNLQGGCCIWCKNPMSLVKPSSMGKQGSLPINFATFEHLVDDWESPDGKDNSLDKIALSCSRCNNSRNSVRTAQAHAYYKTKFETIQQFHEFSRGKKPSDFIRMFGVCPQFNSEAYRDIMKI